MSSNFVSEVVNCVNTHLFFTQRLKISLFEDWLGWLWISKIVLSLPEKSAFNTVVNSLSANKILLGSPSSIQALIISWPLACFLSVSAEPSATILPLFIIKILSHVASTSGNICVPVSYTHLRAH